MNRAKRDYLLSLLFILLLLIGFGLLMIYSTSSYSASLNNEGNVFAVLKTQLIATAGGVFAMLVMSFFPYEKLERISLLIYIISLILIFLVLTKLGSTSHGATRWFKVAGFSVQPAEIVKIAVILFTAYLIRTVSPSKRGSVLGALYILFPAVLAGALLYFITDNLSSAIIVCGIAYLMLFLSARKKGFLIVLLLFVVLVAVAAVVFILYSASKNPEAVKNLNFRGVRILAWLNPEAYADGKGYQTLQSLYGIGSGGVFGKGLGNSILKLGYLPEASNDMIFSIVCEELGLFGALCIILLFVFLLMRLVTLSTHVTDSFGNLIVVGVFCHIAVQVILNIAVVTNTIPNTGISLPFISSGGSSIICLMAEMGIVVNIAIKAEFVPKDRQKKQNPAERRKRPEVAQ